MKQVHKLFLFSILIWTIPFFASFLFFNTQGEILIDQFLFESIITTFFLLVLMFFTVLYFRTIKKNCRKESYKVAGIWFGVSIFLDLLILIPFAQMAFIDWFMRIGIRYLIIPITVIGAGFLLEPKHGSRNKN